MISVVSTFVSAPGSPETASDNAMTDETGSFWVDETGSYMVAPATSDNTLIAETDPLWGDETGANMVSV
jgi:hypothetical protein